MASSSAEAPSRISLVALPESSASVLYGLYDVLTSVGRAWTDLTGEDPGVEPFDVQIVGSRKRLFRCAGGVPVTPHHRFSQTRPTGIVIVTDLTIATDTDPRGLWPEAVAWVRNAQQRGAVICSVCTGSVLLAEAGVLAGEVATSHWSMNELFRTYYPDLRLATQHMLVTSGADHGIVTAGGARAWEDLALYLIARYRGEAEAVRSAKVWVIGDHTDGQLPFKAMPRAREHDDAVVADCQVWIASRYDCENPVAAMCQRSGLADRTFKRRFRMATGFTPLEYVQSLRVEEARQMLETGDLNTEDVGREVGYEDPAFFRALFKRRTGVTPARYRRRFQQLLAVGQFDPAGR